jgi:predicted RNase H-like HicB family nuclease
MRLTAVYMKVPEGYVAFVEELPGANTQGETLEEARANLEEAVTMVLEANRELSEQSLEGAEVIRETLILPGACNAPISFGILDGMAASFTAKVATTPFM